MHGFSLDDLLLDLLVEQAPRPTLAAVLAPWRDVLDRYNQLLITRWGSASDLRIRAFDLRDHVLAMTRPTWSWPKHLSAHS